MQNRKEGRKGQTEKERKKRKKDRYELPSAR